ncbi:MAG: sigma-70 family RNA polymerase sigma factor [Saprospirales bacterium]|nr:sigma-70 family RNA polymerase sigma factor [Saprospirales bacterium]
MRATTWNDETLLRAIQGERSGRDAALRHIFQHPEWNKAVDLFVRQYGGNTHDADDVFQEAVIQLDKNIRLNRFEGNSALKTYFVAIAKRIWWKMLERRRSTDELQAHHIDGIDEAPDLRLMSEERKSYLRAALGQIGARCKEILQLYQLDYSMEEIASAVGLSNPEMAKKEAYRCRMRLRQFFENNGDWKALVN